jgi:hypothetical protein
MRVYNGPVEDCDGNGTIDFQDLIDGTHNDCNGNGVPDQCDLGQARSIRAATVRERIETGRQEGNEATRQRVKGEVEAQFAGSLDLDGDGVPDECCSGSAPALADVEGVKNRVLSIQIGQPRTIAPTNPLPPRPPQALRVTFVPGAGEQAWSMYVGPPKEVCENSGQGFNVNPADCASVGNRPKTFTVATLRCEPYFTDWHEVGAVYVYHPAIAPEGQFVVQTINDGCGLSAESNYSAGLNLATGKFGDTVSSCATNPCGPPNAVIDAADVLAALDKFRNTPTSSRKFRVDLEPATLDGVISVTDITIVLNAFSGGAYPFETPTPSCP